MTQIMLGDCLEQLKDLADNSVDSICTDPPYGLSFMGKAWDYDVPTVAIWKECLRVLKPGGHLLAFGGTRTYHRLVVNIEDAGFEIRDQIMWIYGSGFPKSMDISKAIDKEAGAVREVVGHQAYTSQDMRGGAYDSAEARDRERLPVAITAPATPEAKKWSGYGTALKPANEPICLARKPLSEKTVAKNVLKHGVGGLNIEASRIGSEVRHNPPASINGSATVNHGKDSESGFKADFDGTTVSGRFPANILFDEAAAAVLDEQSGHSTSRAGNPNRGVKDASKAVTTFDAKKSVGQEHNDSGGASRFFKTFKQDEQCDQRDLSTVVPAESSFKHDEARLNSVQEAVRISCSNDPLLSHCLGSIPDYKKCTLYQDLASLAVEPESIDTTLIMRSLLKLYGSAHLVTDESIKSAKNEETGNTEFVPTRFLYQAKASKKDRNQGLEGSGIVNNHATVKPIKLMEYLVKLVTPEGGVVLDPFMGSGTTGVAALGLGFKFVGVERDEKYFEICEQRIRDTLAARKLARLALNSKAVV